jgi:hypothetical protein
VYSWNEFPESVRAEESSHTSRESSKAWQHRYAPDRKEWRKRKAKENHKRAVNEKRKEKCRWKPTFWTSRTSKNGGWLTTTDLLMCLQHLYLGSSTPTTMYPCMSMFILMPA